LDIGQRGVYVKGRVNVLLGRKKNKSIGGGTPLEMKIQIGKNERVPNRKTLLLRYDKERESAKTRKLAGHRVVYV